MEFTYEEKLNTDETEKIIVHITIDKNNKLTSFAVILLTFKENCYHAIRKYDQSEKENFNIHTIINFKETRIEQKKELVFETIEDCVKDLKKNWLKYKLASE
jgi:predicted transposase YbfD/YdcC